MEKYMKEKNNILLKAVSVLLLVCTVGALLCSCGKGNKFLYQGEVFKDKKTDVVYRYALACYEPISTEEEVYGSTDTTSFYALSGKDPLKWLCEESGTIFYAEDVTLPYIDEMDISYADICAETTSTITRQKIVDGGDLEAIINGYVEADGIYYLGKTPESTFKIRFADTSLGIYYSLTFIRYADDYTVYGEDSSETNYGKDFLYNRFEDKFVPAPAELVKYVDELV